MSSRWGPAFNLPISQPGTRPGTPSVRLRDLAATRVRYGYRRLHVLLEREGWKVNHKRVYRLYREEGLGIRVKRQRKRVSLPRVTPAPPRNPQERWSLDFLTDSLVDGRRFRVLTIVGNVSRVSPAIEVAMSLTGDRVVDVLERLRGTVGVPERIAIDNGPEFISKVLDAWAYRHAVCLEFSRPDKPTDNAIVESFNGHFRAECLDQHWFESVEEARQTIELWRVDYNTQRPHRSLQQQTRRPSSPPGRRSEPRTNAFPGPIRGAGQSLRTNVFPGPIRGAGHRTAAAAGGPRPAALHALRRGAVSVGGRLTAFHGPRQKLCSPSS